MNKEKGSKRNYRNSSKDKNADYSESGRGRAQFLEQKICWLLDENTMVKRELGRMRSAMEQVIGILTKQGHIINLKREKKNSIPYFNDLFIDILEEGTQKEQFEKDMENFDRLENTIEISIENEEGEDGENV